MYTLLIVTILLLVLSLFYFQHDFFSPSFLIYAGYFISISFGVYAKNYWDIALTNTSVVIILIVGFLGVFFAEAFVKACHKEPINKLKTRIIDLKIININYPIFWLLTLIDLLVVLYVWRDITSIAGSSSSIVASILNYKNAHESLSSMSVQLVKITKATAFVYTFIFINNYEYLRSAGKKVTLKGTIILINPLIYIMLSFLKGGRIQALGMIFAILFLIYLYKQRLTGSKFRLRIKLLIKIIFIFGAVLLSFYLIRNLVGRSDKSDFLNYITLYLGAPYKLFDLYISNPPNYGHETFCGMVTSLNKILGLDIPVRTYPEFRLYQGIPMGNIYTSCRGYFNDFGMIGVFVLCFIKSFIFNVVYYKTRVKKFYRNVFCTILYASLVYSLIFDFFYDFFFTQISVGFIIEVIIMYFVYLLTCKGIHRSGS